MRWFLRPVLFTVCAALTACAQPKTAVPTVSQQELVQEKSRQKQLTSGQGNINYETMQFSAQEKAQMKYRLQRLVSRLAPQATTMCRELHGPQANCNMHVELSGKDKGLNAYADGEKIVIHEAMVHFTQGYDNQLAFVLAHEYAHHMMEHVDSTRGNVMTGALLGMILDVAAASQGANTDGLFSSLGASGGLLAYSPEFEHEADYLGLYMLYRAGFDVSRAPMFWRRMAQYDPSGIYSRTTHPTTPERFVMMNKTIQEIVHKHRSGQRLLPNIKPQT